MWKNRKTWIEIAIGIIIFIALLLIGMLKLNDYLKIPEPSASLTVSDGNAAPDLSDLQNRKYASDVNLTEEYLYPEVYDIPFQKSVDGYTSNRELTDEEKQKLVEIARGFFDSLLNTGYRDIQTDPEKYVDKMLEYTGGGSSFYSEGLPPLVSGRTYVTEEAFELFGDDIVTGQKEMENTFVTNTSLVYYDAGGYWVRGVLENIIHGTVSSNLEKETLHTTMFDVLLLKDSNAEYGYDVAQVVFAGGATEEELAEMKAEEVERVANYKPNPYDDTDLSVAINAERQYLWDIENGNSEGELTEEQKAFLHGDNDAWEGFTLAVGDQTIRMRDKMPSHGGDTPVFDSPGGNFYVSGNSVSADTVSEN